jgi:glyceraldehyde 3-phosphate dehydrogenase
MTYKVAINGFGRIGRNVLRASAQQTDFEIVAINDITSAATLAHLLKYDSIFGKFDGDIEVGENAMVVNGKEIRIFAERNPQDLPWAELGVECVVESTGIFRTKEQASWHLDAGAKKVIISAPAVEPDITLVLGVNDKDYDHANHHIISNASCTTNCVAPVVKVLHDNFTILNGNMTTIHSYTNDQRILDLPHKDLRRARAAAMNIIPTTTGAAKAVGLVIEDMKGKLTGSALRVPTPNGSLVDLVVNLEKPATVEQMRTLFKEASEGHLKGILGYSEEPLVSSDIIGDSHSSVLDSEFVTSIDDTTVKVLSWYDNEWGYSCRVRDLIVKIAHS